MLRDLQRYWRLFRVRTFNRGWDNTWRMIDLRLRMLRYNTPKKMYNFGLIQIQKWLRRERLWGMPYRYNIDPTNICNLKCPLCPTGLGILKRRKGKMPLEAYKSLIDQIAPYAYWVELYNWGEPFLHPQIFDMIRYAHERDIFVRMSSNMNYFDPAMAEKTVASGLDALIISVDGATEATYQKLRRGGQLSRVIENVKSLVEAKRQAHSRQPYTTLRMLVHRYNEGEINQVRQLAADLGVDAFTTGTLFVNVNDQAQVETWLPENEAFSYYDYAAEHLENSWNCADLWEAMIINWDGGVSPCCWIHNVDHDLDNTFTKSLKTIWNGPAYISARRVFALRGPKPPIVSTVCAACRGNPKYLDE